ncbi:nitroreductase family deazaflavin-dependent oxidoreductase [Aeromicrobium senzhongii]|uniref:Nitroreductase family deazaflavin-dependent oxidoreductase n=1 Tax=Aeromicrobium senzhongii TaxID=2663859 RepID=A0ABX6SRU2_9ACTN|nr:nitroreductase/quinone reductase family protein [Aeromicrobium senzhongii]MTB87018.1 nitroreductase family deazaflavin-dependent oxidoreductase [Aeromicrobium senzhongii]QNL93159.1 nitroreductase family deazaflavin-dependent oxidoreductase [Aeromicrobium senzhongii]
MTEKSVPGQRRKQAVVNVFQRYVANPVVRRIAGRIPGAPVLLETTGRTSGQPRRNPVGGRLVGDSFWLVSEHGLRSQYVKNLVAEPRVRLLMRGRWHTGIAHVLPDDDPQARLRALPRGNSAAVRALGTSLLTIRVDLDRDGAVGGSRVS